MKKYLPLLCGLLTLCLLAIPASPAARAADTGRTITLEAGKVDMRTALKDARDGDTIVLNGNVGITDMDSKDAPWVIDKAVTIRGGELGLWAGGIILDADVTFRDTDLAFDLYVRNAIMANGHTLTLENVTCSSRPVNLFCGGLYDPEGFGSTPGTAGAIVIKGNTSLKGDGAPGNLYAGNLCMGGMNEADSHINGPANQYAGSASIRVESGSATLGDIYAGGAQQRIPVGSASGKVILTDPEKYTTAGPVDVRLTDGAVKTVDGAGADAVSVTYNGGAYSTGLTVKNVSGLRVETGALAPTAQSGLSESTALSVSEGAKLDLTGLGDVTVGGLEGGGTLLLGQSQSLTVTGNVTGRTTVGIGSLNPSGHSTMQPIADHPYLRAPQSEVGAFLLAPPEGSPDMQLTRAETGDWSVPAVDAPVLVETAWFANAHSAVESGGYAELPLEVTYVENGAPMLDLGVVPLTVLVNGSPADSQVDELGYYSYTTPELLIEIIEDLVYVQGADGTYSIELAVPGAHTADGRVLSAQTVLAIGADTPPAQGLTHRIRSVSADDAQVAVDVATLSAGADPGATVLAAAYTRDGMMCAVSMVPVTAGGRVSLPLDSAGADFVAVFLVDGSGSLKPVCWKQNILKSGALR